MKYFLCIWICVFFFFIQPNSFYFVKNSIKEYSYFLNHFLFCTSNRYKFQLNLPKIFKELQKISWFRNPKFTRQNLIIMDRYSLIGRRFHNLPKDYYGKKKVQRNAGSSIKVKLSRAIVVAQKKRTDAGCQSFARPPISRSRIISDR